MTEEGNLKIRKANQGDGRNFISIQLNNYIYDMHKNGKVMVTATVKNGYIQDSIILNEQSGIVSFYLKASANGSGKKVDVKLEVKTFMVDGEKHMPGSINLLPISINRFIDLDQYWYLLKYQARMETL